MAAILRIETIGRCVAYVGDRRIDASAEVVLAGALLFGLEPGRKRTRAEIASILWPDTETHTQRSRLRWLLSKLRSTGLPLESDRTHAWLEARYVHCDFDTFGETVGEVADQPLAGYEPQFSRSFSNWLEAERSRVQSKVLRHLLPRLNAAARAGNWQLVASLATSVRRVDQLNEEGCLRLAEAYCRLGERTKGLAILGDFISMVGESRPEAQLQARLLEQRIRSTESSGVRSEPSFVGRTEHLRSIDSLLRAARDGVGGALVLTGSAGIGKTRILNEASLRASMGGMQVVRVNGQRGDTVRPLSGFSDLAATLLELPGALGCDPEHLQRLRRITHAGSGETANQDEVYSQQFARIQIGQALLDVIAAVSEEAPLCIAIDDLQWLDSSAEWAWNVIVPGSFGHRVAWVFTARAGRRTGPDLQMPCLSVPALDYASANVLLSELLDRYQTPPSIDRSAILARGAGSPLFLRELVRHCSSNGASSEMPTTLIALLDAGIATLSKFALRVLQVASILGTYASLDRIEAVARLRRVELLDAVSELESAAILSADALGVTTGHVLWAEAAISQLTTNVARLIHRHAAEHFEHELAASMNAALLWECARHWEMAGDLDRAKRAVLEGAEMLERTGLTADAASAYGRAMQWALDPSERLSLLDRRLRLLHEAGGWHEALPLIDEYQALASDIDPSFDGHSDHEIRRWRIQYYLTGDFGPQTENAFRCAATETATIDHRLLAARECALAAEVISTPTLAAVRELTLTLDAKTVTQAWDKTLVEYMYELRCGDQERALELSKQLIEIAAAHPDRQKEPIAIGHYAGALTLVGRVAEARDLYLKRIAVAKRIGLWIELAIAYDHLIGLAFDFESLKQVEKYLAEMQSLVGRKSAADDDLQRFIGRAHTAQLRVMQRRYEEAEHLSSSDEEILRHPARLRARLWAVRLVLARHFARSDEIRILAEQMAECFRQPDSWLDWPATILGEYLRDCVSAESAWLFVTDYVSRVRRERYAPPSALADLVDSLSHLLVQVT